MRPPALPAAPLLPLLLGWGLVGAGCGSPIPEANDYCAAPPRAVVELDATPNPTSCPFGDGLCDADYLALPELQPGGAPEVMDEHAFQQLMDDHFSQRVPIRSALTTGEELRREILEGARIDWILDGFEERPLEVSYLSVDDTPGARRRQWQLDDPLVGRFRGTTLLPDGDGPFPAVLVFHGHTQTGREWIEEYDGQRLVEQGFAVLAPTFRVNDADVDESRVTEHLLRRGLTFVGVRMVEQLLTLRYAASLPEVDPCRIGGIGRSGGSISGNLTSRVTLGLTSWVTDLTGSYFLRMPDGVLLDETAPDLYRIQDSINDLDSAHLPVLQVGYGYVGLDDPDADRWPRIVEFLEDTVAR